MDIEKKKNMLIQAYSKLFFESYSKDWIAKVKHARNELINLWSENKEIFSDEELQVLNKYKKEIQKREKKFKNPKLDTHTTFSTDRIVNLKIPSPQLVSIKNNSSSKIKGKRPFVSMNANNSNKNYLTIPEDRDPYKIPSLNSDKYNTFKKDDGFEKQFIDEGIGGTREENKRMRGQIFSDLKKRSRGDD